MTWEISVKCSRLESSYHELNLTFNHYRHYSESLAHSNEPEIIKLRALPKKSKERKHIVKGLILHGDFKNNMKTINEERGYFIVLRKPPTNDIDHNLYVSCDYCKGRVSKRMSCKQSAFFPNLTYMPHIRKIVKDYNPKKCW